VAKLEEQLRAPDQVRDTVCITKRFAGHGGIIKEFVPNLIAKIGIAPQIIIEHACKSNPNWYHATHDLNPARAMRLILEHPS
jgi:hypothetical protein